MALNSLLLNSFNLLVMEAIIYAEYSELRARGIKRTINLGKNAFGFNERIVELNDGTRWNYIPEDQVYEKDQAQECPAGCPYCGSYEGDATECPECGHGQ
jgi:hypothetical protein